MDCGYFVLTYNKKVLNRNIEDAEKIKIISDIINTKQYINFRDKCSFVKDIISKTVDYIDNNIIYNSNEQYYTFIISIITLYTDLEMTENGYDILCKNNLLDTVIASIGREYEICLGIMNNYMNDLNAGRMKYEKEKV